MKLFDKGRYSRYAKMLCGKKCDCAINICSSIMQGQMHMGLFGCCIVPKIKWSKFSHGIWLPSLATKKSVKITQNRQSQSLHQTAAQNKFRVQHESQIYNK